MTRALFAFDDSDATLRPSPKSVSDRSAYYLLANIDEHPEVLPMAYDIATENLAALEVATDLTEFRDSSASLPQLIEHLSQLEEQRLHPWRNPDDAVATRLTMYRAAVLLNRFVRLV